MTPWPPGTDQRFNLLVGRQLQEDFGQPPQTVITLPLLEGTDGVQKMSKSLNNYIGINDPPKEMFGKLMSISDVLMWRYFDLLSLRPTTELEALRRDTEGGRNPRDVKFELAEELVDRFHGAGEGARQRTEFLARFSAGVLPDDIPEISLAAGAGGMAITNMLKQAGLVASTSEARRLIKQGGVRIDEQRVGDEELVLESGTSHVVTVGKRRISRVKLL